MYTAGDTVTAMNPHTNQLEQGTVAQYTKHGWLHVAFSTGTYRLLPAEVQA